MSLASAPAGALPAAPGPGGPAAPKATTPTTPTTKSARSGVTATTVGPTTTITVPAGGPPIAGPPTTSATPVITAPPPDPIPIIRAVEASMARVEALARVPIDTQIAGQADSTAASVQANADLTSQNAFTLRQNAEHDMTTYRQRVASIAVAVYANPLLGMVSRKTDDSPEIDATVILPIIFKQSKQGLDNARKRLDFAARVAQQALELGKQATTARAQASVAKANLAHTRAVASGRASGTSKDGISPRGGPTILGPVMVTAGEMAAWFISTGHHVNTAAAVEELAGYFSTLGGATGVRGDIAFTQSILETGWFTFPAGGQLNPGDNNFAGIGACDHCTHGFSFKDAATGVEAQLELLRSYASPKPTPTPALGKKVAVYNCCPTWMALTGVWATSSAYGTSILSLYQQLLDWVVSERIATAGLS